MIGSSKSFWRIIVAFLLFFPLAALAQTVGIPSEADISRLRPPPLEIPPTPEFDLRIETPERAPTPRAVDELRFSIQEIRVEGMTQYSRGDLAAILDHLIRDGVSLQDLRDAAEAIEARYRADGFFLVRVFVPPQRVENGIFTIRAVEGYVEAVYAEGASDRNRAIAERLTAPVVGQRPIDLQRLERALLLVNDYPGIAGGGILRPGTSLGASELVLALVEPSRANFSVNVNNNASNLLGPWGFAASALFNNPLPYPGQLSLGLVGSADFDLLRSFNARYASGIGSMGLVASLGLIVSQSRPNGLGVESQSSSLAPRARIPLQRTRATSVYFEVGLTASQSQTELDGTRITEDKATVADAALIVIDAMRGNGSTQLGLGLSVGTDWFGALGSADRRSGRENFDQKFTKLTYTLQRNQNLPGRFSGIVVLRGQYSSDRLISGEQISFGGVQIGRGYDGGAIAGDRGLGGLVELRWDMPQLDGVSLGPGGAVQWFASADWASVKRAEEPSESLRSISAGGRYRNGRGWTIDGMVAYGQTDDESTNPRSNPRYLISTTRTF